MKTLVKISTVTFLFAVFNFSNATAQSEKDGRVRFNVAPEVGIPIGSLSDRYSWSLGGSLQAEYPVLKNEIFLTANTGFHNLFLESNGYRIGEKRYRNDLKILPVKLGVKYFPLVNFYIHGEAGTTFLLNGSKGGYEKSASFAYSPQVGYRFKFGGANNMDVGIKWDGNTKFSKNGKSNNLLLLRIAYEL